MKIITLHQPWASLIADGTKDIETRSWAPPEGLIGKRIGIHAGRKVDIDTAKDFYLDADWRALPIGAIVCTAVLEDVGRVVGIRFDKARVQWIRRGLQDQPEDRYGNFAPGRCLWLLSDVTRLSEPIPARGFQGLWDYSFSAGLPGERT